MSLLASQPNGRWLPLRLLLWLLVFATPATGLHVTDPDDLRLEGGQVWRVQDGVEHALACADTEGTGTLYGAARHPGGTWFLAAERGLFRVSPEVDHLDRIELGDGAPDGPVVGVALLDHDTLWLATRDAVGCVNSRFFFGRTFTRADGLPAPPYRGLRATAEGALVLETEGEPFLYVPGSGEPPRVRVLTVDGQRFEPGRRYDLDASGSVPLALESEGQGTRTYRYRLQHHHLWVALDGAAPRVEGLEPGEHTLLVTAWDGELRRSEPVAVPVRVAYPAAFDKRRLVPLALAGGGAVLLGFLLRARLRGGGRASYLKAAISTFLSLALGLQLLVGLVPHGRSWPFVGFTMYLERYERGSVTYKMTLQLVTKNGKRHPVEPYDAGYGLYEFRRTLSEVMHGDEDARAAYLEALRDRYWGPAVTGFLILDERRRLTPDGPVTVAPTVLCAYPEELFDAPR